MLRESSACNNDKRQKTLSEKRSRTLLSSGLCRSNHQEQLQTLKVLQLEEKLTSAEKGHLRQLTFMPHESCMWADTYVDDGCSSLQPPRRQLLTVRQNGTALKLLSVVHSL